MNCLGLPSELSFKNCGAPPHVQSLNLLRDPSQQSQAQISLANGSCRPQSGRLKRELEWLKKSLHMTTLLLPARISTKPCPSTTIEFKIWRTWCQLLLTQIWWASLKRSIQKCLLPGKIFPAFIKKSPIPPIKQQTKQSNWLRSSSKAIIISELVNRCERNHVVQLDRWTTLSTKKHHQWLFTREMEVMQRLASK
jgi:hypothetical protein